MGVMSQINLDENEFLLWHQCDMRIEDGLKWWPEVESNHRHGDFQSPALPTELSGHLVIPLLERS